jgi:hypothetical protein
VTSFDAAIDLTAQVVEPNRSPAEAVEAVRAAIEDIPGAGWVSVEWCVGAPRNEGWVRLYEPGRAEPQSGVKWDKLARLIEDVAINAARRPR